MLSLSWADWLHLRSALTGFVSAWSATLQAQGCRPAFARPRDPRLEAVLDVLERHGRITPVPYQALSAATGWSRSQIDRLCQRAFAATPRQLLERRCLDHCLALMREEGASGKEIAARLGFSDGSHLVKWFRRLTGATPKRQRQMVGQA